MMSPPALSTTDAQCCTGSVLDLYNEDLDPVLHAFPCTNQLEMFIYHARLSKHYLSSRNQLLPAHLERLRRYMQKWHNIVSRYCGSLPEVRHAHEMVLHAYYGAFTASHIPHMRVCGTMNTPNISDLTRTLEGRLARRVEEQADSPHEIIRGLLIATNPLCSFSPDCTLCILACMHRLQLQQKGIHRGSMLLSCGLPNSHGDMSVRNGVFSSAVGKLNALVTRDRQTTIAMAKRVVLHMKVLRRILREEGQ